MSLTEILALPEVSARFSEYVRRPVTAPSAAPLLADVRGHNSYALVGTAFDYGLRFSIAACNPGLVVEQTWAAELGLALLERCRRLPAGLSLEQARQGVARARFLYAEFLEKKIFTRRLARATLFLAALDRAYRIGPASVDVRSLHHPLRAETDDCFRLMRIIPRSVITAQERASLNPSFGEASTLVGGADADFVIDSTLVDIKTTKHYGLTAAMLHQLVGYRMLLAICEPQGSTAAGRPVVTHGGIYFSRYGRLERFPFGELIARRDFLRLGEWLIRNLAAGPLESRVLLGRLQDAELF